MNEYELRDELVRIAKKLDVQGLNRGTAGNLSARHGSGFLVTPSGMDAEELTADDIVFVDFDGSTQGRWRPSSEWLFHRDILMQRPEFGAVVHTHSVAASTLACLRKDIPPFHYMIALAGGDTIRCADYATFGTQALSDNALIAMKDRKACLLANHGMIAAGKNLAEAFKIAVEVENLCELYLRASQLGHPYLLTAEQFRQAQEKFADYGKPKQ
ncbi:MAG: class II aldolase/adducin family protein [Nitrosomonadales bacterium]|nr:class II aldolase/adducin family protein [Nitrosomonadales bacterium]